MCLHARIRGTPYRLIPLNKGFLQKYNELFGLVFRLSDLAMIVLGGALAYIVRFDGLDMDKQYQLAIAVATLAALVLFPAFGLYQAWRGAELWSEIRKVSLAWSAVLAVMLILMYLTKAGELYSRLWFGTWFLVVLLALSAVRVVIRGTLNWLRSMGRNIRLVVVLGAGGLGRKVAEKLTTESWTGLRVVGFFDDDPDLQGKQVDGVPVYGTLDDVPLFVDRTRTYKNPCASRGVSMPTYADQVWVALPLSAETRVREVVRALNETTVDLHFVPNIFGYELLNQSMDDIAGIPVLNLSTSPMVGSASVLKALEDMTLASVFTLMAAPLMAAIALGIKLDSKGPVIFKQRRYGLDGRQIVVWKFRTMTVCEDGDVVRQAKENDDRTTRMGRFLRRTSFDELPQLFNVLRREMSLVGPRPHAIAHNEQYRELVDHYMLRHKVKPGITGLAQVEGFRGEITSLDKMKQRVAHDISYIRNWSLWLDIKIIALTAGRVLFDRNAY